MNKQDELINLITDTLDECTMLYYNCYLDEHEKYDTAINYNKHVPVTNYYECLIKVVNFFLDEKAPIDIRDEEIVKQIEEKLIDLENKLGEIKVSQEVIRFSMLLLDTIGFKNLNFSLDIITPNGVAMLVAKLVKCLTIGQKKINIVDPNFGVGNLAFCVTNNLDCEFTLTGFDSHELMAKVAGMKANMIQTSLQLNFDDCLNYLPRLADFVVSDLATYDYKNDEYSSPLYNLGITYFPYLVIENYLNLQNKAKYVYVIDNDFFSQKGNAEFKKMLDESANLVCLITLPESFFSSPEYGKSIIILDNEVDHKINSATIFNLPSTKDEAKFKKVINDIEKYLCDIYHLHK